MFSARSKIECFSVTYCVEEVFYNVLKKSDHIKLSDSKTQLAVK
jgi:hypothetical protein